MTIERHENSQMCQTGGNKIYSKDVEKISGEGLAACQGDTERGNKEKGTLDGRSSWQYLIISLDRSRLNH